MLIFSQPFPVEIYVAQSEADRFAIRSLWERKIKGNLRMAGVSRVLIGTQRIIYGNCLTIAGVIRVG